MYIHSLCRVLVVLYLRTYFINHVYNHSQIQVILNQIFRISPFISFLIFVDFFFPAWLARGCGQKKKQTILQLCLPNKALRASGDSFTTEVCMQLAYLSKLA